MPPKVGRRPQQQIPFRRPKPVRNHKPTQLPQFKDYRTMKFEAWKPQHDVPAPSRMGQARVPNHNIITSPTNTRNLPRREAYRRPPLPSVEAVSHRLANPPSNELTTYAEARRGHAFQRDHRYDARGIRRELGPLRQQVKDLGSELQSIDKTLRNAPKNKRLSKELNKRKSEIRRELRGLERQIESKSRQADAIDAQIQRLDNSDAVAPAVAWQDAQDWSHGRQVSHMDANGALHQDRLLYLANWHNGGTEWAARNRRAGLDYDHNPQLTGSLLNMQNWTTFGNQAWMQGNYERGGSFALKTQVADPVIQEHNRAVNTGNWDQYKTFLVDYAQRNANGDGKGLWAGDRLTYFAQELLDGAKHGYVIESNPQQNGHLMMPRRKAALNAQIRDNGALIRQQLNRKYRK